MKKKKKRNEILIMTDYNALDRESILETLANIRSKIRKIMRNHIGEENYITPVDLFEEVLKIKISSLNIFERSYWWNVIKKIIGEMRKDDLFIINKNSKVFVLCNKKELGEFENKIDNHIDALKTLKQRARKWVWSKEWEKI